MKHGGDTLGRTIINETFEGQRRELETILQDLKALIARIDNPQLLTTIVDILAHVEEPFLFVVVGEIKSGKSSFINALLRADVCRVDPAPCTDIIQQIVYADEKTETTLGASFKRIGMPVDILKKIAVVDTPGTNTIVRHHQEITQNFIPNSGLVLFVFPAKNPHTQSAWELLDYVNEEWRRRVVFILQQADLTTKEELSVNTGKVREYAITRGITSPHIFSTSATMEQKNDPSSGFDDVRRFIRETVTGGRHNYLKLITTADTAEQILKKVYTALQEFSRQLESDQAVMGNVTGLMEEGRSSSHMEIRFLVDRLLERYDTISEELKTEFEAGLKVTRLFKRSLSATFNRKNRIDTWVDSLQKKFETRISSAFEEIAGDGAERFLLTVGRLLDSVMNALDKIQAHGKNTHEPIIGLDDKRQEVVTHIRKKVAALAETDILFSTETDTGPMTTTLMQGSALTLVGAVILASTHVTFLDITGGILTGAGVLLAGGVLVIKKGKIVREFRKALREGRSLFEKELHKGLSKNMDQLHNEIQESVSPFFHYIRDRQEKLDPLVDQGQQIHTRLMDFSKRLEDVMPSTQSGNK